MGTYASPPPSNITNLSTAMGMLLFRFTNVSAPPYAVVMTTRPHAIASCATRPQPSPRVGSTTAVAYC